MPLVLKQNCAQKYRLGAKNIQNDQKNAPGCDIMPISKHNNKKPKQKTNKQNKTIQTNKKQRHVRDSPISKML